MKTIQIADITLREVANQSAAALSFKERIELARSLDRLRVDRIELPPISDGQEADVLTNKTIASVVASAAVMASVGMSEDSVTEAWESVKAAKSPALQVLMPVSAIQMEYLCHRKGPAVVELTAALVRKARYYTEHVALSALDATRAEGAFLSEVLTAAVEAGAEEITLCDTAGVMTPFEWEAFLSALRESTPALERVRLGVELSDELKMSVACAAAAVAAGAEVVKTTVSPLHTVLLEDFAAFVTARGESCGIRTRLRTTELVRVAKQLQWRMQNERSSTSPFDSGVQEEMAGVCLSAGDDIGEVAKVVKQMGYDLGEEDTAKVYEAFRRIADKKHFVGVKELEAIVATSAFQVPSTYRIDQYVVTNGNRVAAMANITLERDGKKLQGVSMGDGPVDAAFLAIEQIIGHHYELDDFQIQTVTEGREAMGSALVKLRSGGRLYSGNGISTDIIGASIRAYISALNKIVYESL